MRNRLASAFAQLDKARLSRQELAKEPPVLPQLCDGFLESFEMPFVPVDYQVDQVVILLFGTLGEESPHQRFEPGDLN